MLLASPSGCRSSPACGACLRTATQRAAARWIALVGAIAGFLVTLPLWPASTRRPPACSSSSSAPWIPRFNVNYHLGVDGISMLFILLNSFMTVLVVIAGWEVIENARRASTWPRS